MLKKLASYEEFISKIIDIILDSISIVAIMKIVFKISFISKVTLLDGILSIIVLSIATLLWRLFGPVLGYRSAIKKCEIFESLNRKEKAREVLKNTLYENKLFNKRRADLLYELAYRSFNEEGIEAVEGYIDEILKLEFNYYHKIDIKLKIGAHILSKIDKHRAQSLFDEIIKNNGYKELIGMDFFHKDKEEINLMSFLEVYAETQPIERAEEIYNHLRQNQCCKRNKTVEKYLKEYRDGSSTLAY